MRDFCGVMWDVAPVRQAVLLCLHNMAYAGSTITAFPGIAGIAKSRQL